MHRRVLCSVNGNQFHIHLSEDYDILSKEQRRGYFTMLLKILTSHDYKNCKNGQEENTNIYT